MRHSGLCATSCTSNRSTEVLGNRCSLSAAAQEYKTEGMTKSMNLRRLCYFGFPLTTMLFTCKKDYHDLIESVGKACLCRLCRSPRIGVQPFIRIPTGVASPSCENGYPLHESTASHPCHTARSVYRTTGRCFDAVDTGKTEHRGAETIARRTLRARLLAHVLACAAPARLFMPRRVAQSSSWRWRPQPLR